MSRKESTDRTEIAHLIEKHRRLIYKVANSYCSNVHEQEDLIQEIIFQIIKGYENFDHKIKVTTWMYKVAFNVSISHYRKIKTRQKYMIPMPEKLIRVDETESNETDESIRQLRIYIEELQPLNKAILVMYLDGNSHAEISQAIGISFSNVGTKINRIKKQIKKKFKL